MFEERPFAAGEDCVCKAGEDRVRILLLLLSGTADFKGLFPCFARDVDLALL